MSSTSEYHQHFEGAIALQVTLAAFYQLSMICCILTAVEFKGQSCQHRQIQPEQDLFLKLGWT